VQAVVNAIVLERQARSVDEGDFAALAAQLEAAAPEERLGVVQGMTTLHFFTTLQAARVLKALEDPFDVVEAAVLLHPRMINQSQFHLVLAERAGTLDMDNIWHRITVQNRAHANPFRHTRTDSFKAT